MVSGCSDRACRVPSPDRGMHRAARQDEAHRMIAVVGVMARRLPEDALARARPAAHRVPLLRG